VVTTKEVTSMTFADVRYMTASDKEKLAKGWRTLVKHGFKWEHFTDRIYAHLTLRVGHIAHFDRSTFYATWLEQGGDRVEFLDRFLSYRVMDDYADVHAVMVSTVRECEVALREQARVDEVDRLTAMRDQLNARLLVLGEAA
jgi:hypothetical protein